MRVFAMDALGGLCESTLRWCDGSASICAICGSSARCRAHDPYLPRIQPTMRDPSQFGMLHHHSRNRGRWVFHWIGSPNQPTPCLHHARGLEYGHRSARSGRINRQSLRIGGRFMRSSFDSSLSAKTVTVLGLAILALLAAVPVSAQEIAHTQFFPILARAPPAPVAPSG